MTTRVTVPVCTAVAKVMHPATLIYSFGFETGSADSWTNLTPSNNPSGTITHRGVWLAVNNSIPSGVSSRTRVITGLTVARQYTFSAWVSRQGFGGTHSLGVTGIGASTPVSLTLDKWTQLVYQFVATATSHTFEITVNASIASSPVYWDDIRLVEGEYQVGSSITLSLKPGSSITLDEGRAPYAEARLEIALPAQADLDLLDTRTTNRVRIQVTTGQTFVSPALSAQSRTHDLLLHERGADHLAVRSSISLICRSDEAVLIDAGNKTTTTDSTALQDQKSLRSMCTAFLENRFFTLASGTDDFDLTVTYALDNLAINPKVANTTGYSVSTGTGARVATGGPLATVAAFYRLTLTSTQTTFITTYGTFSVTPGKTYRIGAYARCSASDSVYLDAYSSGVFDSTDNPVALTAATWQWIESADFTPTAGVTSLNVRLVHSTTSRGSGTTLDISALVVAETTGWPGAYFDGSTATDAYYSYAWDGTVNASVSHRIRLDARDQKLLYQDPGVKDWDFLRPILQASGLRLFCDEQRVWRLVNPTTYLPAGTLTLSDPKRGSDRISRESGDWVNAVVVKYTWIDDDGLQQVAYDAAYSGLGDVLLLVENNSRYPGPGAAAVILARYTGRGRVQDITALPELAATPGMALSTTLPNTPDQLGYVSKVQWSIGDNDAIEMSITARDLVDA